MSEELVRKHIEKAGGWCGPSVHGLTIDMTVEQFAAAARAFCREEKEEKPGDTCSYCCGTGEFRGKAAYEDKWRMHTCAICKGTGIVQPENPGKPDEGEECACGAKLYNESLQTGGCWSCDVHHAEKDKPDEGEGGSEDE